VIGETWRTETLADGLDLSHGGTLAVVRDLPSGKLEVVAEVWKTEAEAFSETPASGGVPRVIQRARAIARVPRILTLLLESQDRLKTLADADKATKADTDLLGLISILLNELDLP